MIISNTKTVITTISAVNELVTFFQWVRSLWSHRNRKENQEDDDRQKLQISRQYLRDTLPAMYNVTDQAEWRRNEKCVAQVLPELEAALYDTEGLLEDFRCYEQKVKIEGSVTSAEPGTKFFHDFIQGNFSKLIHIQQRLRNQYRLLEGMSLHQASPRFDRSVRPKTTSFPTEVKIFGRDYEIQTLIKMLGVPGPSRLKRKRTEIHLSASNQVCGALDNNDARITSVPVLPIVGIGGVGKTTLAQIICHHPRVKEHFDLIVWICVSGDFDVKRLTKEAIEQISGKTPIEDNLNSLQADLADILNKRRHLVVLDDLWNENGELWKAFYAPFKDVLEGNKMLVTTRSLKVSDIVHTVEPFILEGLKDDIFHEFFKLCAFGSDSSNSDPELEWICKQILPKLKGSPLAAKICGRLLGMSLDPAHWNSILKSQLWEQEGADILPALQLSYMYLPARLKLCFLFCAMFPENYDFEKEYLVSMWVASGFVEREHNIPLQQTGCKYFEELANLSFLQERHGKYVMHDLIRDMALQLAKEKNDLERIAIDDTQAATSSHTYDPPMWPLPVSRRQRGQIDSDSSILKVLETVLCMNKHMSNALHREKQARKRDSKRIKRGLRQIKRLRMEVSKGKEVSASGSEAEEEEVESEGEQYPDFDALISQVQSEQQYGRSYAPGGGYGYGFGGQFHTGPSSSAALQHHQQFGPQTQFAPSQFQRPPPQTSDDFASTSTVAASIFGGAPPL